MKCGMRRLEDMEQTPRRQQTMSRRTIFEAKKCFQDYEILSIDFVSDLTAYFCVFFDVLLGQRVMFLRLHRQSARAWVGENKQLGWIPKETISEVERMGQMEDLKISLITFKEKEIFYFSKIDCVEKIFSAEL